jgi:hypothetical protein
VFAIIKPDKTNTKVTNLLIYYYECDINEYKAEKLQQKYNRMLTSSFF